MMVDGRGVAHPSNGAGGKEPWEAHNRKAGVARAKREMRWRQRRRRDARGLREVAHDWRGVGG